MKLKKLLPLAGLTGIAAVAAPLVTSCAEKGTTITWESGDDPIVLNPVAAADVVFKDETKMLEGYLSAINTDKTIMSKDIIKVLVAKFADLPEGDIKLNFISVRTDNVDVEKHLVTTRASIEIKEPGIDGAKSTLYNVEWTIKNMEYVGVFDEDAGKGAIFKPKLCAVTPEDSSLPTQEWFDYLVELSKDEKWSFDMTQSSSLGTTIELHLNHSNIGDLPTNWIESLVPGGHEYIGIDYISWYYSNATEQAE